MTIMPKISASFTCFELPSKKRFVDHELSIQSEPSPKTTAREVNLEARIVAPKKRPVDHDDLATNPSPDPKTTERVINSLQRIQPITIGSEPAPAIQTTSASQQQIERFIEHERLFGRWPTSASSKPKAHKMLSSRILRDCTSKIRNAENRQPASVENRPIGVQDLATALIEDIENCSISR